MRQMTAADLCDECGRGDKLLRIDPKTRLTLHAKPCPNCRHQTPAERVIEAALTWATTEDEAMEIRAELIGALYGLNR